MFSRQFHSHKIHLLVLLGLLTDRKDRFPYPFIYFNPPPPLPSEIPTLSVNLS